MTVSAFVEKGALISPDGLYRYSLTRRWEAGQRLLRFVMLNPSTADMSLDDPTIRRCISFARREGFDGLLVLNLYALRATDPRHLWAAEDPVGPDNDSMLHAHLVTARELEEPVVAAWGANAGRDRVEQVLALVAGVDWRCLGVTTAGQPRHPLYVRGDRPLEPLPT
jgi:hypothetical protein